MPYLNPSARTPGGPQGLEAEHRTNDPVYSSLILLHDILQRLRMVNANPSLVPVVVVHDRCCVGTTLIDRDFLGQFVVPKRLVSEGLGGSPISLRRE